MTMRVTAVTTVRRAGFTFLELVVVISVIAALAAMGFPAYKYIKRQVDIGATQSLVNAVAAAITIYPQRTWTWSDANPPLADGSPGAVITPLAHQRMSYLWDLNHDNGPDCPVDGHFPAGPKKYYSIDGTPEAFWKSDGPTVTTTSEPKDRRDSFPFAGNSPSGYGLFTSGYTGFYDMVQPSIHKRFVNKKHQVVDSWGQPLRIAFAANTYGASWFGVWSAGPDLKDDTEDDLCSWKTYGSN
jgi:prepilin-type N-terminal cleavage/methylation domain-containing protein